MNVYGQSTDGKSGFLHQSGSPQERETASPLTIREEYGWQRPPQFSIELKPHIEGVPESLPPAKDSPEERWVLPRKTG